MNIRLLLAAAALALLLPSADVGAGGAELLLTTQRDDMGVRLQRAEVVQAARVDASTLSALRDARQVMLEVFGQQLSLQRQRLEARAGGWTWEGTVNSDGWAQFIWYEGRLAGTLQVAADGPEYHILPLADGGSAIARIDARMLPPEGQPLPPPGRAPAQPRVAAAPVAPHAGTTVIDVLATYTAAAAADVGGRAGVVAQAWANVAWANHAFRNNHLDTRMNLVAVKPIDLLEPAENDWSPFLRSFKDHPGANAWRDAWGADIVTMYVHRQSAPVCGKGYIMSDGWVGPQFAPWTYNLVWIRCVGRTFAHESGHNMGLEHDAAASGNHPDGASFPWAFGYGQTDPANNRAFRSIMAYPDSCGGLPCTQLWGFSNPAQVLWGYPTGIEDEADNVRALQQTKGIVSAYRPSQMLFQDGFD